MIDAVTLASFSTQTAVNISKVAYACLLVSLHCTTVQCITVPVLPLHGTAFSQVTVNGTLLPQDCIHSRRCLWLNGCQSFHNNQVCFGVAGTQTSPDCMCTVCASGGMPAVPASFAALVSCCSTVLSHEQFVRHI